jgi:hypothetical protein
LALMYVVVSSPSTLASVTLDAGRGSTSICNCPHNVVSSINQPCDGAHVDWNPQHPHPTHAHKIRTLVTRTVTKRYVYICGGSDCAHGCKCATLLL